MSALALTCPQCHSALPQLSAVELGALTECPQCRQVLEIALLPGFGRRPVAGQVGVNRVADDEPACFFHPSKRAEVPCDQCGRYVCALCRLELDGRNICPGCLSTSSARGRVLALEAERLRWDVVAWMLVLLPLGTVCFWFLTPITCLAAIGIGLWKRNRPPSRIHRSRARLWAATGAAGVVLVASGLVLGWVSQRNY